MKDQSLKLDDFLGTVVAEGRFCLSILEVS